MAGELTNLESRYVTCHQDVMVRTTLDDDLRLIRGWTSFISGLVVHCIFQLPTVRCDLNKDVEEELIYDNTDHVVILQICLFWN